MNVQASAIESSTSTEAIATSSRTTDELNDADEGVVVIEDDDETSESVDDEDDEEDQEIEIEEDSEEDDSDDDDQEDDHTVEPSSTTTTQKVDMVSWAKERNDTLPEDVIAATEEQLAARARAQEVALLERCLHQFYKACAANKSDEVVSKIANKFVGKRDMLVRFLANKYENEYDALRAMRNDLFPDD